VVVAVGGYHVEEGEVEEEVAVQGGTPESAIQIKIPLALQSHHIQIVIPIQRKGLVIPVQ
jgi:hypothetical protein